MCDEGAEYDEAISAKPSASIVEHFRTGLPDKTGRACELLDEMIISD